MLGVGVFFGDRDGIGRTFQQVPNGLLPSMAVARFVKETTIAGPFATSSASTLRRTCCRSCSAPRATRCTVSRSVLPVAVADARSRRRGHLLAETGISCGDAGRASPDGHDRAAGAPTRGADHEPLRTNQHPQTQAPGSRLVRMLQRHPRPLRATRVVAPRLTWRELPLMRRAVFGEPLLAHPPKIGCIDAPGSTRLVDHQRANACDENGDGEQHGLDAAGTRRVIASIVPHRAAAVCAVVHIPFRGAPR